MICQTDYHVWSSCEPHCHPPLCVPLQVDVQEGTVCVGPDTHKVGAVHSRGAASRDSAGEMIVLWRDILEGGRDRGREGSRGGRGGGREGGRRQEGREIEGGREGREVHLSREGGIELKRCWRCEKMI